MPQKKTMKILALCLDLTVLFFARKVQAILRKKLVRRCAPLVFLILAFLFWASQGFEGFQSKSIKREKYLVDTAGCRIPDFEAFDPSIESFLKELPPLKCSDKPPLVESNLTHLSVNKQVLHHYNVNYYDLTCCYRNLWRVEGVWQPPDDWFLCNLTCVPFEDDVLIHSEFVQVECYADEIRIYFDSHAFVPLKPAVERRCSDTQGKSSSQQLPEKENHRGVSVIVIGVDSVSRLNLHRQMPKTVSVLKGRLNAIEMLGYNKVADNTFPNLVPVLSGLTVEELREKCWPTFKDVFDDCPWIWKNFSNSGYRTVFGEDCVQLSLFNTATFGFEKQPTDYYLRPYMMNAELKMGRYPPHADCPYCVGPRKAVKQILDHVRKFAMKFDSKLSFAFYWTTSLSHSWLNDIQLGDDNYSTLLSDLLDSGSLNNTLLIFMSDHGIRSGDIRRTFQGRTEEMLPFLFLSFPSWFQQRYPSAVENVQVNGRRLTSPFDLHETLKDLLDLSSIESSKLGKRARTLVDGNATLPRGVSLFLPISKNRTCDEAHISRQWCTCVSFRDKSVTEPIVQEAADYMVAHLNHMLKNFTQCAQLKLRTVEQARIIVPQQRVKSSEENLATDLSLIFQVNPGRGVFESIINFATNESNFKSIGFISRINRYGNQSWCVKDRLMKLYCYCVHQL